MRRGISALLLENPFQLVATVGKYLVATLTLTFFLALFAQSQSEPQADLLPAFDGKHFGFINTSGKTVIPFQYDLAEPFSEGLALVMHGNQMGFVDARGEWKIRLKGYARAQGFSEGLAAVGKSTRDGFRWGFVDKKGELVIPLQYYDVEPFSNELALVGVYRKLKEGGTLYGYIDLQGKFVIPPQFKEAKSFSEGLALVHGGQQESSRARFIDKTGSVVFLADYGLEGSFAEGLAFVSRQDKYGYIDKSGAIVIDFQFTEVHDFHDGLARVKFNRHFGFVNREGKFAVEPKYADASDFSDGVAAVSSPGGQSGIIDLNGNLVAAYPLSDPVAVGQGVFSIRHNVFGWAGYVNRNGEVIHQLRFGELCPKCFGFGTPEPEKLETVSFKSDPSNAWVYLVRLFDYESDSSIVSDSQKLSPYLCSKSPTPVDCEVLPNSYVAVFALNGKKCVLHNVKIRRDESHKYFFPFNSPPPGACQ